jgi:hypothetical protein
VNGEFGTFHGLGDLSLLLTHTLVDNDRIFLKLHVGAKLPTNDADLTLYGLSVPMSFQTSLGTYQLIAGLVFHSRGWLVGAGYQRSYGPNNNRFRHADWPNEPLVWDYPESPFLERSDDIAFRFQKNFHQGKSRFFLGLLPLYHLHRDKIKEDGVEAMVEGSDGLTLNIQAGWTIDFAKAGFIRLMTGFPVIAKSVDTDGLGRSVAIQGGIGYRFP